MTQNLNKVYIYLFVSLAVVLTFPGRFVFGVVNFVHFNMLVLFVVLTFHGTKKLGLNDGFGIMFGFAALVMWTVAFYLLLSLFSPVTALTSGLALFVSGICSMKMILQEIGGKLTLRDELKIQLKRSLILSSLWLAFFLLRDIIGFGTFTLPVWKDILVLKIPFLSEKLPMLSFAGTIPGALLVLGLILAAYIKLFSEQRDKSGGC